MIRCVGAALALTMLSALAACTKTDPLAPPVVFYGQDVCARCGMIISDERFAAAAIMPSERGHVPLLFDDVGCLLEHDTESPGAVRHYVRDLRTDRWLPLASARFVHSRELHTPMASGVAAMASAEEARAVLSDYPGDVIDLAELRRRHAQGTLGVMQDQMAGDWRPSIARRPEYPMTTIDPTLEPDQTAHDDHDHPAYLAHHFETPSQQFEAAKLGMWLFLATEFLLFSGLFCLYAVYRFNQPELFAYGSQFLNTKWGAINTVVLILSSMTMATAVSAAQLGRQRLLVVLLSLTFLGGAGFMGIKYVEYRHKFHEHLVWGTQFYVPPAGHEDEHEAAEVTPTAMVGDIDRGREQFLNTCRSCHGAQGEGIPGQGKDQRGSAFIADLSDQDLVAFIKVGRMPFDPLNTTGIQMPPKGGNPLLTDDNLLDIVAYMRTFDPAPPDGSAADTAAPTASTTEFFIPRSSIPPAPPGPPGMAIVPVVDDLSAAEAHAEPDPRRDPTRPANAHIFFGIYFMMTGLHGLHVLAGMIVIAWLIARSLRGDFGSHYFTPVDLGGLYWHVVDLIWIFLFPLLYLI